MARAQGLPLPNGADQTALPATALGHVRGIVSEVRGSAADGNVASHSATVVGYQGRTSRQVDQPLQPNGLPADNLPSWARQEPDRRMFRAAGLVAIVRSKGVVIDPLSAGCAVITGAHNLSPSASARNDKNTVIVRGHNRLAQASALHIEGVHDHFAGAHF